MSVLEPIKANVLAVRLIPNVEREFAEKLNLRENERSIGFFTADIDDATYTAIDEATKQADVRVAYAKSFYAGSGNASGLLSGEIIAVLAGPMARRRTVDAGLWNVDRRGMPHVVVAVDPSGGHRSWGSDRLRPVQTRSRSAPRLCPCPCGARVDSRRRLRGRLAGRQHACLTVPVWAAAIVRGALRRLRLSIHLGTDGADDL